MITIYDCRVVLNWSGTASDGTAVSGKLTIPEVSHEITLDGTSDYVVRIYLVVFVANPYSRTLRLLQYEWSLSTARSPAVDALFSLAKSRLPSALEAKFAAFPAAIIDTHGKDLTVSAQAYRQGTPAPSASASGSVAAGKPATDAALKKKADGPGVARGASKATNTTTVTVEANFMAAADDLFSLLTDEKRIPQWTRAPAKVCARVRLGSCGLGSVC